MSKKPVHYVPLTIGEVFEKLESASSKTERAEILKINDHPALRAILRLNFDPAIKFELPEGAPEKYKPNRNPKGFGSTHIKGVYKKFYIFVKSSTPNLRQNKRETIFLQTLEQLDNFEADILIKAKDKKLDFGLTKKLVNEVFPGLIPGDDLEVSESAPDTAPSEITTSPEAVNEVKVKRTRSKKQKETKDEAQSTSEGV